ncbi:MAG: hypothetical protein ABI383_14105 [Acidobacteriaceae bacterium]
MVMEWGDEEVGEFAFALQLAQEIDDLRADAHIERGDGLVEDEEAGVEALPIILWSVGGIEGWGLGLGGSASKNKYQGVTFPVPSF